MRKTFSTNTTDSGGHVAVFYDSPKELWRVLAEYFKVGMEQGELGVFVTHFTSAEVISSFKDLGLDIRDRIMKGDLRIFDMVDTYLHGGRFVSDFMIKNVLDFIEDARAQGYSGIRTAGEMSWLDSHPDLHNEAILYEKNVNNINHEHPDFTGICLYAIEGNHPKTLNLKSVLSTHPSYIYKGELFTNPEPLD